MGKLAEEAQDRLRRAREIADAFQGDERLHHLGMAAVFLFEDMAFTLANLAEEPVRKDGEEPSTSTT